MSVISLQARYSSACSELGAVLACLQARKRPNNLVPIWDGLRVCCSDILDYPAERFQHNLMQGYHNSGTPRQEQTHRLISTTLQTSRLGRSNDWAGIILSSIFM